MKRYALLVGVDTYRDPQIRDLSYSVADAFSLNAVFEDLDYQTKVLANPTRLQLITAIRECNNLLRAGDKFFFYFAGHGWTTDGGAHLLFCSDDVYDPNGNLNAGLSFDGLKTETIGNGYDRVFVLDACRNHFREGVRDVVDNTTRNLRPISELLEDGGRWNDVGSLAVIRSCSQNEHAIEIVAEQHGLFTLAMRNVLRAAIRDGQRLFWGTEFCGEIIAEMNGIAARHEIRSNQTPEFAMAGAPQLLVPGNPRSNEAPAYYSCPICGKNNLITETFNCRKCNTDYLCLSHKSSEVGLCEKCHSSSVVSVVPESRDIKNVKCADIPVQTFKNATVHPECHLFDEELDYALVKGKDYVVQYEDADSPGFATAVITGMGKYRGERRVLFEIKKEDVQEPLPLKKILCNQFKDYIGVYDGKAHSVSPSDNALADASGFKYTWYNKNTGRWDIVFPKYVDVCDVSLRIKIEATGYLPRIECRRIKIARRDLADSMVKKAAVVRSATGELLPDIVLKDRRPCVIRKDDWEVLECDENHIVINGKRNYSGELDVRLRGEERNDIGNGEMEIVPLKSSELGSNVSSLCCNTDSVDEIEEKRECKNLWPLVFFWIVGILVVQGGLMIVGVIVDLLIGLFVESVLGISHTDYPQREISLWCVIIVPTIVTVLGALLLGLGFLGLRENKKN